MPKPVESSARIARDVAWADADILPDPARIGAAYNSALPASA